MFKRLFVGVAFLMLGAFGLQAQSDSTQQGSQSGTQQERMGTQQDTQSGSQSGSQTQLSSKDKDFVQKAYKSNMSEIELGKIAAQKASSDDVKQFAQQMVDEHQRSNDQLEQIAREKGIDLPSSVQIPEQSRWTNLSGPEFDREYVRHQMKAHKDAVSLFQNEANSGQDPELKSFASNQLSNLEQHSNTINALNSKVASGAESSTPSQMGRSEFDQSSSSTSTSSSTTTTTTDESGQQLPRTGSNLPLIGLVGFMLLAAALIARSFRLMRNNR